MVAGFMNDLGVDKVFWVQKRIALVIDPVFPCLDS